MKIIRMDEEAIKAVFETAADQGEALVALYRMVFGADWDHITKLDGWPTCNQRTWKAIARLFMEFDKRIFPIGPFGLREVMPGGAWMNSGFSSRDSEDLKDWQVRLCGFETAEEQANAA